MTTVVNYTTQSRNVTTLVTLTDSQLTRHGIPAQEGAVKTIKLDNFIASDPGGELDKFVPTELPSHTKTMLNKSKILNNF